MNTMNLEEFTIYNDFLKNLYKTLNVEDSRVIITEFLSKLVPFDSLAFFLVNPKNNEFINTYHYNIPEKMFEDYKNYYEKFDLYKEKVFSCPEIPPVDRASDYFDFKEWENNIHRKEFLIPNGCYYIACIQILANKSFIGEISIHRNKDKADFSDKDMLILKALQPHICNAFVSSLQYTSQKSPVDLLLFALECKDKGIIIMDDRFKIFFENEFCSSILGKEKEYKKFVIHIKRVCAKIDKNYSGKFIENIPNYSGKFDHKDLPIAFKTTIVNDNYNPSKCIYITTIEPLSLVFGISKLKLILTEKEFHVAELISKGLTLKEIAKTLIISIDTVKTHVKKIYMKTKCKSKTDLIIKFFI
jgi:DNA-binding CsgD family transcriptional regulator